MTQGLFYWAARKVGSVFQYSSCTPGKDRFLQRLLLLSGNDERPNGPGAASVWLVRTGREGSGLRAREHPPKMGALVYRVCGGNGVRWVRLIVV